MNTVTGGQAKVGSLNAQTIVTKSVQSQQATWTLTAEAANNNTANVAAVITDGQGNAITVSRAYLCYLADDALGATPATVAPSGGMAIGTNGKLTKWTTNLSGFLVTDAQGRVDITVIESGAKSYYLVLMHGGGLFISPAMTFA